MSPIGLNAKKSRFPKLRPALEDPRLKIRLTRAKIAVFLDYDGTITPIVDNPSRAVLSKKTRKVLENLATLCPVIILSGRDVENVKRMVGLENITYAGSHGFDIVAKNGEGLGNLDWDRFIPALNTAEEKLRIELKGLPGVLVERKRFAIAVHYRKVAGSNLGILKRQFVKVAGQFPSLKKTSGKRIYELLPNVHWNKGTALISLMKMLGLDSKFLPLFVGDDLTDEDAFHAIRDKGVGIVVGKCKRATSARYFLRNYIEVRIFLEQLVQALRTAPKDTPTSKGHEERFHDLPRAKK